MGVHYFELNENSGILLNEQITDASIIVRLIYGIDS
ncbi:hypothetical protein C8R28_10166 [Nitrosomonas ureae]|uniref:Uncharacterized protein n=1 Tax=Nitrosomonas ureae TaxID=44577 RepID=A0A2T5ILU9_9PROT|nr:hypothetical protein C8R28_10166 [Nitrosomonas ureae]